MCDDVTPPDTTLVAVRPTPTQAGYVRQSTVTFDFAGVAGRLHRHRPDRLRVPALQHGDPSHGLAGLRERAALLRPGRHRGHAVHVPGPGGRRHGCRGGLPDALCADEPDFDPTPATTTIKVDTNVPNTFMTRTPQDDIRPDWPVTLTRSPQVALNSNQSAAGFVCTLNDKPRPAPKAS